MMVAAKGTNDFDTFFRAEYPKLVAIAFGLTGNYETGCELAQETLLRCHRSWSKVAEMDAPGAWARRVVINLATDVHRVGHRVRRTPDWVREQQTTTLADPVIDGWWTAVRALPDRQRAAVVLHYLEDRPLTEVAVALGVAVGTVKATLAKARKTLSRTLAREG
jgi:RNA polymerase sigma-70 factor (ECF subfamily)